ncbi:SEC-C domain-containing protein [Halomonas sp. MA07-2]|uniref:SEC-C domain-containing protein n=1 Tax=Halomonas sp. MA07-2 TaxID=3440841 RepID=UPI003EEA0714
MKVSLVTLDDTRQPAVSELLDKLSEMKKRAVANGDEELANNCWRKEESLKLNILYIEAFYKLKNHEYREAWWILEKCEIYANFISENSSESFLITSRVGFVKEKVASWQSIYPYCVFASPGFTVGYYTCSICNHKVRPRSRCGHKKGRIYNGELCLHVAHDMEFFEVSIVTKPVQKYSVLHDDETLDFSIINHLLELLDNPFENWGMSWTRQAFSIERFERVLPEDKCPCKSGKSFKECCLSKNEVEIPHVDFILSKELPEGKDDVRFPY